MMHIVMTIYRGVLLEKDSLHSAMNKEEMELSKVRHVRYAKYSILIFLTVMVGFIMELHSDHQIGNKEFSTTVNSEGIKTIVPVTELHHYHNSFFLTINVS